MLLNTVYHNYGHWLVDFYALCLD